MKLIKCPFLSAQDSVYSPWHWQEPLALRWCWAERRIRLVSSARASSNKLRAKMEEQAEASQLIPTEREELCSSAIGSLRLTEFRQTRARTRTNLETNDPLNIAERTCYWSFVKPLQEKTVPVEGMKVGTTMNTSLICVATLGLLNLTSQLKGGEMVEVGLQTLLLWVTKLLWRSSPTPLRTRGTW